MKEEIEIFIGYENLVVINKKGIKGYFKNSEIKKHFDKLQEAFQDPMDSSD